MSSTFLACARQGDPISAHRDGDVLTANSRSGAGLGVRLEPGPVPLLVLDRPAFGPAASGLPLLLAIVEMLSSTRADADRLDLDPESFGVLRDLLIAGGLATEARGGALTLHSSMAWQRPEPWRSSSEPCTYPLRFILSAGRRHPQRPPKPVGVFYTRFIPWLETPISFRAATLQDLDLLHAWMNSPRVNAVWGLAGSRAQHESYLAGVLADPHKIALIGAIGGDAFGYFEVYWAKEDRLAPFYDAGDYDRGWHVLVGEERFRGKAFVSAWLPSLLHALFLDDPRTDRIVGEPSVDHKQQLRNLERSGFATLKTFDFPTKRAALVMLLRERFFDDHLWRPAADGARETREPPIGRSEPST